MLPAEILVQITCRISMDNVNVQNTDVMYAHLITLPECGVHWWITSITKSKDTIHTHNTSSQRDHKLSQTVHIHCTCVYVT